MKIEKVNDHQIRCTLTKSDLADRQMKISELAYGTDKAKSLFRDMMQQASYEFGFEAEDIPLMIEAIPLSGECIVLIITKVEDPEELDSRLSGFMEETEDQNTDTAPAADSVIPSATVSAITDDVIDLFKKFTSGLTERIAAENRVISSDDIEVSVQEDICKLYSFESLDDVIRLAGILKGVYDGENTLYEDEDGSYILVIHQSSHAADLFNRICNIASEYGDGMHMSKGYDSYLAEHVKPFIEHHALARLAELN
ncbi:MAG: adaptor protein MecA [Lachnospiraceae bacterium]|nr:adaptor protein MecA [Lachnospiraceae bacterium]